MEKQKLAKVKVVEIFFEEDPTQKGFLQSIPSFLLENGQIKHGVMINQRTPIWVTDYELEESQKKRIISPDSIKLTPLNPRDQKDVKEINDIIKHQK